MQSGGFGKEFRAACNFFFLCSERAFGVRFRDMKSSTKDKIKGTFEEAKGGAKEKAGQATGDRDMQDRGTVEKTGGKIQRKVGDVKKVFDQ